MTVLYNNTQIQSTWDLGYTVFKVALHQISSLSFIYNLLF